MIRIMPDIPPAEATRTEAQAIEPQTVTLPTAKQA